MAGQEKTLCLLYCYKGENKENNMSIHSETRKYEVVVVGGGLAGVCAAIAAARKGARTAIIQNRSMFGGNASSEIRMHIVGANSHGAKKILERQESCWRFCWQTNAEIPMHLFRYLIPSSGKSAFSGKSGILSEYEYG